MVTLLICAIGVATYGWMRHRNAVAKKS